MNERIRDLVTKARKQAVSNTSDGGKHFDLDLFHEKFAELITQECIQYLTIEAERLYALRNDDGDLLAEKCYDNIQGLKEHFGVE